MRLNPFLEKKNRLQLSTEYDILSRSIGRLEDKYDSNNKRNMDLEVLVKTHLAENSAEKIKNLDERVSNLEALNKEEEGVENKRSKLLQERGTILGALAVVILIIEKLWPLIEQVFSK